MDIKEREIGITPHLETAQMEIPLSHSLLFCFGVHLKALVRVLSACELQCKEWQTSFLPDVAVPTPWPPRAPVPCPRPVRSTTHRHVTQS